jgi:hypothetical protein
MPDNSQIHTALVKELTDVLVRFHEQHLDLCIAEIRYHTIMQLYGRMKFDNLYAFIFVQPEGKKPNV